MRTTAWAHATVALPPGARSGPDLDLAGDGRAALRIRRSDSVPTGPPPGTRSFPAVWHSGRWAGEATITRFPFWSWGYEIDLALAPPGSLLGRVAWPRRRLERLAAGLVEAMRTTLEEAAALHAPRITRRVPSASATATSRWLFVSATSNSPSR